MPILDERCRAVKTAAKSELAARLSASANEDPDALPGIVSAAVADIAGSRLSEEQASIC